MRTLHRKPRKRGGKAIVFDGRFRLVRRQWGQKAPASKALPDAFWDSLFRGR
jgi:hypothetical protein